MNQDIEPRPTPPAEANATGVRQGFITGRVLTVLLVSIALAVAVFVAASIFS